MMGLIDLDAEFGQERVEPVEAVEADGDGAAALLSAAANHDLGLHLAADLLLKVCQVSRALAVTRDRCLTAARGAANGCFNHANRPSAGDGATGQCILHRWVR